MFKSGTELTAPTQQRISDCDTDLTALQLLDTQVHNPKTHQVFWENPPMRTNQFQQAIRLTMCIYFKNIPVKFHPDTNDRT